MKRFRFTLAALKTLRERREQEATEAYGKALQVEQQAKAELARAKATLDQAWQDRQAILDQGVAARDMVQLLAYCQNLQRHCQTQENQVALARQSLRQKWDRLLVARREREVVDQFLQRQKHRHSLECLAEEQKLLDELAGRETEGGLSAPLTSNPLGET